MGAPAKAPFPTCRQSLLPTPFATYAAATGGPSANSCQQPLRSHRRSALPRPLARSALAEPLWSCAEYQQTLGLLPCLRHPLIDTFRNSPIDEQVKILCPSHTMLARRDVSRAVIPPLGVLHRRELRDHDSFIWSFTLDQLEWPVHCVEFDVEPHGHAQEKVQLYRNGEEIYARISCLYLSRCKRSEGARDILERDAFHLSNGSRLTAERGCLALLGCDPRIATVCDVLSPNAVARAPPMRPVPTTPIFFTLLLLGRRRIV
jgi:hypothetical protein